MRPRRGLRLIWFNSVIPALLILVFAWSGVFALQPKDLRTAGERAFDAIRIKKIRPDSQVIVLLVYINRRFGLKRPLPWSLADVQQITPVSARVLLRFAFPEFLSSESEVKILQGIDRFLASALYCDIYPLPWDFYLQVESAATQKTNTALQALKASAMLQEKKCAFDSERIANLQQSLIPIAQRVAGSFGPLSNSRLEAMIVLLQVGGVSLVKPEWIAEVLLAQRGDATLSGDPVRTLLASWLFLEYSALFSR